MILSRFTSGSVSTILKVDFIDILQLKLRVIYLHTSRADPLELVLFLLVQFSLSI